MAKRLNGLKIEARTLRRSGKSYTFISRRLGVAKSTLHYWLHPLPLSPYQRDPRVRSQYLARARILATRAVRMKKQKRLDAIRQSVLREIKNFPLRNLKVQKAFAALLYWAEGAKTEIGQFKFANTDPALTLLFLTLLRNTFSIQEDRLKIYLYLHHYHNVRKMRKFWSSLLNIPENQFAKVYIKSRKKTKRKRKNFAGICFIRYGKGAEELRQYLLFLGRAVQEQITQSCARSSVG